MNELVAFPGAEAEKLEAAYPRWCVWQSDSGRWWASVRANLTVRQERAGCRAHVSGDCPQCLALELATEDELVAQCAAAR